MKQASQWWTKVSKIAAPGQAGIQKLPEHVDATDDIGNLPSIAVLDPWFNVQQKAEWEAQICPSTARIPGFDGHQHVAYD